MNNETFVAVERYIEGLFVPPDQALDAALQAAAEAGMPQIHVSPGQGKLLYLLAKATGARRVLELGTLAGYSTIWLARALPPGGALVTLEINPEHAALARANLARAGLDTAVRVLVGPALESLAKLVGEDEPPFDLVFIDADKPGYPEYLQWALRLTRAGSVILADNVVRGGGVCDAASSDEAVQAARAFNAALAADPRVEALVVQQVGVKGHDGLAIAVRRDVQ